MVRLEVVRRLEKNNENTRFFIGANIGKNKISCRSFKPHFYWEFDN